MSAETLSGPQKAALVILFLEEELAAQVLSSLSDEELRALGTAVEELDPVPHALLTPVLEDFEKRLREPVLMGSGTSYMRRLATSALGHDRAQRLFVESVESSAGGSPLDALREARSGTLAELLAEEHPQVAAVILTQLPASKASEVLLGMESALRADLVVRVAKLEEIPERVLRTSSESIMKALAAAGGLVTQQGANEFEGFNFAASLLNELGPEQSAELLEALEEAELDEIADRIREAMFTFEDLGQLDSRNLQQLLREVSTDDLAIALRSAGEELREAFFGAMSSRAAATLREDIDIMPPRRLSEVEEAQKSIVEIATAMAADGRIQMPTGGGEELV